LRAHILHTTDYRYPLDARDSFNELRLQPADDDRQTVLEFKLEVEAYAVAVNRPGNDTPSRNARLVRLPDVTLERHLDYFGTQVQHVHVRERHRHLRVQTRSVVITQPTPQPGRVEAVSLIGFTRRQYEFMATSKRVPLETDWTQLLGWRPLEPDTDLVAYLDGLTAHLNARFTYAPGTTSVNTPLGTFVQSGLGVCQDYVHAMLGVCRRVGIPARYVSGYLYAGQDFVGAEATHAWLECFVPGAGWLGFDPTNNVRVGESHIKIGHGRDYDDVPPIKGYRTGGGAESLGVEVQVDVEEPVGTPQMDDTQQ
jgi:transglutaminase-like putative cysteine protease